MYSKRKQILTGLFFGIVLVSSIFFTNMPLAAEQPDTDKHESLDARWLPWIGTWRLVSNKVNTNESTLKEEYLLTISPGSNAKSIIMKSSRDDKMLVEEEIIADGLRNPLNDDKCTGYYKYSWSETGKRLLLESESNCPGDLPRQVSGMSILDENQDWIDIQLLQNGKEKAISIRKYRNVDSDSVPSGSFIPGKISMSRIAAGKKFSISEIIELNSKIESEVLEAALLETRKPFPINSKQLIKLSDSGVNSRVIDLMVAFSFPDKFTVERKAISMDQVAGPRTNYRYFRTPYIYYSYYNCPILPWHWTASSYSSYGCYTYLGWYAADGTYYPLWSEYPYWWSPTYGGGGGENNVTENVNLVNGQGYVRANPGSSGSSIRRARPRNAPPPVSQSSGTTYYPSGSSSSSASSSSSGSASSSGSGTSSAPQVILTPQGYRSGR